VNDKGKTGKRYKNKKAKTIRSEGIVFHQLFTIVLHKNNPFLLIYPLIFLFLILSKSTKKK